MAIRNDVRNVANEGIRHLQQAGRALIEPGKLDAQEGLQAFKTLHFLGKLVDLLPPAFRNVAHAVLMSGVENLAQQGGQPMRESMRGAVVASAVKRGIVREDMMPKDLSQQERTALRDASANQDLATVKSILRHHKKQRASGADADVENRKPATKPKPPTVTDKDVERAEVRAQQRPATTTQPRETGQAAQARERAPAKVTYDEQGLPSTMNPAMRKRVDDAVAKNDVDLVQQLLLEDGRKRLPPDLLAHANGKGPGKLELDGDGGVKFNAKPVQLDNLTHAALVEALEKRMKPIDTSSADYQLLKALAELQLQ